MLIDAGKGDALFPLKDLDAVYTGKKTEIGTLAVPRYEGT